MTRWLETDTLSNQDISTALAVGAYTADADRLILVQVFADQVAGNGDYELYVTQQINGAGSSYRLIPITTAAAASGVTAIAAQSGMIAVRSGDVLTVYLDGLAGDNSTPDTTVRWFELAALRPTTADRTLDVSAGGEAGVDWGNIGSPTATVNLSGTSTKANETAPLDAAGTRASVGLSAANLDTQLSALPTAAENASQVRTELTTELARIDAATSTRLATAGYTAPLDAAGTRTAIGLSAANLDTQLSAINAKTTNLPASPAAVGSPMALADDAITAAKFDKSTAFPLTQADTGSTAVARTGADSDTLETLSDQIDGVGAGTGTGTYTDTVTDGVDPLDNVLVQLSTDSAGANMAYRAYTGADGVFAMHPDPGTYYVWLELAGYSFTQGAEVTVT